MAKRKKEYRFLKGTDCPYGRFEAGEVHKLDWPNLGLLVEWGVIEEVREEVMTEDEQVSWQGHSDLLG